MKRPLTLEEALRLLHLYRDQPAKYERAALRRCRLDVASGKRQAPGHVAEAGSVP